MRLRLPALACLVSVGAFPQSAPNVIESRTHVVLVNVVVKDRHGKPVDDLRREDFVLRDNGQEQKITLFAVEQSSAQPASATHAVEPLTFTNRPPENAPPVTAFLFDELNTQLSDQQVAKKDFLRHVRGLPPDSRVAVFVLGDSLMLLHDFSGDMASLMAAIEKHANRASAEVDAATAPPASSNSLSGDQKTTAVWDSFMQSNSQAYVDFSETVRATRTAAALETIALHLEGIPGRKTLVWISGGFPIQLGLHNSADSMPQIDATSRSHGHSAGGGKKSSGGQSGGNTQVSQPSLPATLATTQLPGTGLSFESEVARAVRALNEADVAVYPVDARGLTVSAALEANRSSIGRPGRPPKAVRGPDFNYETLDELAEETGGVGFHNIKDLSAAMDAATGDARVSYALAFSPAAATLDGSYHKLELTVDRPGLKVRYRPGYVASPDIAVAPTLADAIANPVNLTRIGFNVHLDPVEGGYKASIRIDARGITLEPKDGKWTGALEFLVVVGKVEQLTTIPLSFTEMMYRQIQTTGLNLGARVKTAPGTAGFSLGFRDIPSGAVGTLHVSI